jgi:hypothetical protein
MDQVVQCWQKMEAGFPEVRVASWAPQRTETQPSQAGCPPNHTQENKWYIVARPTLKGRRGACQPGPPYLKFHGGRSGHGTGEVWAEGIQASRIPNGMFDKSLKNKRV